MGFHGICGAALNVTLGRYDLAARGRQTRQFWVGGVFIVLSRCGLSNWLEFDEVTLYTRPRTKRP